MSFEDPKVRDALLRIPGSTQEKLESWLRFPPKFTILRVNLSVNSRQQFVEELKLFLEEQYKIKSFDVPKVTICDALEDLVIIESSGSNPNVESGKFKEVIVGALCGCSVLRGSDVFAPGVLNVPNSLKVNDKVSVYADMEHKCLRGSNKTYQSEKKVFVGNGVALMSREDLFKTENPSGTAIRMTDACFDCPSLSDLTSKGGALLQNFPSIVCSHVLLNDLPVGQPVKVLDMCAAPGGKTTHLAQILKQKKSESHVVAIDKSKSKIQQINANCELLKLDNVLAFAADSTRIVSDDEADRVSGPPFDKESFDRILLDAPCTALGQRPQFHVKMKEKEFLSFPKLQKKLFKSAVDLLKPRGTLVYSTCSPSLEENEEMVKWALDNFPTLKLEKAEPMFGAPGIGIEKPISEKVQRFYIPQNDVLTHKTDTIGFFIAKFRKTV